MPAMIPNHIAMVLPAAHATTLPASSHLVAAMPMVVIMTLRNADIHQGRYAPP
jgi:hypothetical protein